jgi:signal peptidase I
MNLGLSLGVRDLFTILGSVGMALVLSIATRSGRLPMARGGMVEIFGTGDVDLYHTAVFRDIYYLSDVLRPRYQEPFTVGEDEYFVCGDNSPESYDSRMWGSEGKGNNNIVYRKGVVPRDYLMGKAFFLYWGDAFKPFENMLPLVPNFSEMKVIYGGKAE